MLKIGKFRTLLTTCTVVALNTELSGGSNYKLRQEKANIANFNKAGADIAPAAQNLTACAFC